MPLGTVADSPLNERQRKASIGSPTAPLSDALNPFSLILLKASQDRDAYADCNRSRRRPRMVGTDLVMKILGIFRIPRLKARTPRRPRAMGQPIDIDPMTRRAIEFGGAAELNVADLELYSRLPPGVL